MIVFDRIEEKDFDRLWPLFKLYNESGVPKPGRAIQGALVGGFNQFIKDARIHDRNQNYGSYLGSLALQVGEAAKAFKEGGEEGE